VKSHNKSIILQEFELLEEFLNETSDYAIQEAVGYILERININLEKARNTKDAKLYERFNAILKRAKLYGLFVGIDNEIYIKTENQNQEELLHISVIVPVFNQEVFLHRCFDSIVNQTYSNDKIECVFVNDCSTDKSVEIIQNLLASYKGQIIFKLIHHEENKGLGEARNAGIKNAEGQYLFFFDSDDEISPNALKNLADLAQKHNGVDIVIGTTLQIYKTNDDKLYKRPFYDFFPQKFNFPEYTDDKQWIKKRFPFHHQKSTGVIQITAWNKLIRKDFIIKNNLFFSQIRNGEDVHWSFYVAKVVKDIAFVFKPTYFYHTDHDGRITCDKSEKAADARLTLCEDIIKNVDCEYLNETIGLIYHELNKWVIPCVENGNGKNIKERFEKLNEQINRLTDSEKNNSFKIAHYIDVNVPIDTCNFRCHYCYITHNRLFSKSIPKFTHSPEQAAQAFSKKRLGGTCVLNLCANGETLLHPDMHRYIGALLQEGHIVMVVTNASVNKPFDEFVKFSNEYRGRLFIKFSFHYLELLRLNLLNRFFDNLQKAKNNGISFTLEITPCDELVPHIEDIKKMCVEKAGALPHITIARDEKDKNLPILTNLSREEYIKIWGQFDSKLFEFKESVFGVKQTDFCFAGQATYFASLDGGTLRQCYREKAIMDLYDNINEPLKKDPIGYDCRSAHCWNAHSWLAFGTIPTKTEIVPTYFDMRNRICADGTEWLADDVKKAFRTRVEDKTFLLEKKTEEMGKVLVYHKIDESSSDNMTVDLQTFETQMAFLQNKKVVYLDDCDPENPENVVIRFDDGYKDSIYYAIDILKKHNYPFEIFVCGSFWNKVGKIGDDDVDKILQNGGRFQYHTYRHSSSMLEMNEQELESEIKVPDNLKNIGNNCFVWLAYPYWKWNEKMKNIVAKHFKGALSGNGFADNSQYALDGVRIDNSSDFNAIFGESVDVYRKNSQLKEMIYKKLSPLIENNNYWLLEVPYYSNIGDVLIWEGEECFLNDVKNAKCLYRASSDTFVPKAIDGNTIILLQGGGNFGDLWTKMQSFRKKIIASYPNNPIIVFPQTVFYEEEEKLKRDAQLFNEHKNLTICARDTVSYEILKKHFTANILIVPDMAFYIPPENLAQYKKSCIGKNLFIKRDDKEFNFNCDYGEVENCDTLDWLASNNLELLHLQELLQQKQAPEAVDNYANTVFKSSIIKEGVELLSRYDKIYTTRLHCAILGCLLGKSVVMFNNSYGKNKTFYETWLQGTKGVSLESKEIEYKQSTTYKELRVLERFSAEMPEFVMREAADYISERVKLNTEKIKETEEKFLVERFAAILKNKPRKLLKFSVHIAEHCNLNCAGCEHFSPLAEKKFTNIDNYEKDCIRLSELSGGIIEFLGIHGGEPLLNPQINDFLTISRKYFPVGQIAILTNGILLEKQPVSFWQICNEMRIDIIVTVYPIKINHSLIKEKADNYGVNIIQWGKETNKWRKLKIDLKGSQNPVVSNYLCYASNTCFQLANGKIYKCWRIAYIEDFNRAFNQNLKVIQNDGYADIYGEQSLKKIMVKLAESADFCRYCNMKEAECVEWQRSKKEISEWT